MHTLKHRYLPAAAAQHRDTLHLLQLSRLFSTTLDLCSLLRFLEPQYLAELEMDTLIDPQLKSKFFALPAELRVAIYAYSVPDQLHIFLREDGFFRFLRCMQRGKDDDPDCESQRSNDKEIWKDPSSDPVCGRRLRSSWGPHWRCEEYAMQMQEADEARHATTMVTLFHVCKRIFFEVAETIADVTTFHVNDLDTLRNLVSLPSELESGRSSTSILFGFILPNLKELNISLRLDLDTYKAFDNTGDSGGSESSLSSAWTGLLLANKHSSQLRRLWIWLDHTDPCSWSVVNERAVLSPFAALANDLNLEVSIDLPKLHPKWESPHRHFTEESPRLPLAIHRRHRQRYHGIERSDGSICVEYKADFPELHQLVDWDEAVPMTMEEVEEAERRSWRDGVDPTEIFYNGSATCTLSLI
ncbi:hypothetical protein K491DRAFT_128108 [Lophiostoma macrostomum CBS 122681]|uniref:DUF7730 domain-containing protein n=1 Tax=Lophiostoma macrostomum CBS 122681 TaxID=1314788 RepID=A0A6A6SSM6_9PLEO|nr:hypothetical protein K491DRAFT_128108 [Lophiostoma macrostomum CBS 122681]